MSRDVERVPEAVALHGGVLDAQHEPREVGQLILERPEPGHKDVRMFSFISAGHSSLVTAGNKPVSEEVVGEELPLEGAARGHLDALGAHPGLGVDRGRVQGLVVLQLGLNQI